MVGIEAGRQRTLVLVHQHRDVGIAGQGLRQLTGVDGGAGVAELPFTLAVRRIGVAQRGAVLGTGSLVVGDALDLGGGRGLVGQCEIGHIALLPESHCGGCGTGQRGQRSGSDDRGMTFRGFGRLAHRTSAHRSDFVELLGDRGFKTDHGAAVRQLYHADGFCGVGTMGRREQRLDDIEIHAWNPGRFMRRMPHIPITPRRLHRTMETSGPSWSQNRHEITGYTNIGIRHNPCASRLPHARATQTRAGRRRACVPA